MMDTIMAMLFAGLVGSAIATWAARLRIAALEREVEGETADLAISLDRARELRDKLTRAHKHLANMEDGLEAATSLAELEAEADMERINEMQAKAVEAERRIAELGRAHDRAIGACGHAVGRITEEQAKVAELEARPTHPPTGAIDYPAWVTKLQAHMREVSARARDNADAANEHYDAARRAEKERDELKAQLRRRDNLETF